MLPSLVVPSGSLIHRDRYSPTGVTSSKTLVVVHDSESGDDSHTSLLNALAKPGDRLIAGSTPPRYYGSGYHAITNGKGGYTLLLGALAGPYAAPPTNKTAWHVCMPGRANQVTEEWQDLLSANHIRGVAAFIVESGVEHRYLTAADLKAGNLNGYTSHWQVSLAWGQTNHWDPGPNFPWPILADEISALVTPAPKPETEEEDMLIRYKDTRFANEFLYPTGLTYPGEFDRDDEKFRALPLRQGTNDSVLGALCHANWGVSMADAQALGLLVA